MSRLRLVLVSIRNSRAYRAGSDVVEGGGTDSLLGSNPDDRFTSEFAEAGKNGLPASGWNGFHAIE